MAAIAVRDPYTTRHSQTVRTYARHIATQLNIPENDFPALDAAALLHDVGKLGVPDAILNKPSSLTKDEFAVVQRHPQLGVKILKHIESLGDALPLVLHHHERFDGAGYPDGLSGEDIPLGARILSVADSLDAMLSDRTYRPALDPQVARQELIRNRGTQFDSRVVDAALQWLDGSRGRPLAAS